MRKTTWEVRHSSPCETGGSHGYSRFFRGKKSALVYWAKEKKARRLGSDSAVYIHHGGTRVQLYERLCAVAAPSVERVEHIEYLPQALLNIGLYAPQLQYTMSS